MIRILATTNHLVKMLTGQNQIKQKMGHFSVTYLDKFQWRRIILPVSKQIEDRSVSKHIENVLSSLAFDIKYY